MVVIFFGLETGSRQREGMEPLSALLTVTLYLLTNSGLAIRVPKSMYFSFHILALILSGTRASSGKLDETNNWSGIGCRGPVVSSVRFCWTAAIESWTRELPVIKGPVKGTSATASAVGRDTSGTGHPQRHFVSHPGDKLVNQLGGGEYGV